MALVFILLVTIAIAEIIFLVALAKSEPLDLIGQAMHPFNMIGFLFLVTLIDFINLFQVVDSGQRVEFAMSLISSDWDVLNGMIFYLLCQSAIVSGMWLATERTDRHMMLLIRSRRGRSVISTPTELGAARICIFISVVATIIAGNTLLAAALQHGSLNYIAGVRTKFFSANPILLIIVTTITPAFILFGSRDRLRPLLVVLPILLLVLALIGGRSKLLYPLIAMAYWVCRARKVSVLWVYLLTPVLIYGIVAFGFYTRYSSLYSSFQQYIDANGGMFGALFDEPSISMAEAITLNVNHPILHRAPWESIIGAFMLPAPRSIFEWKPFGVSTDFSMTIDHARFMLVKSEWTVTGFIDMFYSFGYVFGIVGCGVIAYFWTRMLIRNAAGQRGTAFVGPIAILIAYQFIRGDIYIVSQFLWPCGVVLAVYTLFKFVVGMALRAKERSGRQRRPLRSNQQRYANVAHPGARAARNWRARKG